MCSARASRYPLARVTTDRDETPAESLTEAWLDAAFAATREARIRRVSPAARGKALVLAGGDLAQLRWMLRLRAESSARDCGDEWVVELRNTQRRVATLRIHASQFLRAEGMPWATLRDGETLARWLSARGFRGPFERWKSDRGTVRSAARRA